MLENEAAVEADMLWPFFSLNSLRKFVLNMVKSANKKFVKQFKVVK